MSDDPIDAELQEHLELLRQERLEAGDSPEQALRYARHRLGHVPAIREAVYDLSLRHRVEAVLRHTRFALRSYGRHGGVYVLATAILSIGIGLSVSLFSLVDAVLLAPLPIPDQERVHLLWKTDPATQAHLVGELAYPELADLQAGLRDARYVALFPAAPYGNGSALQTGGDEPVQIETSPVTPDFFRALGVSPAIGRDFNEGDAAKGAAPVIVLSDRVWRERFGGRADVLNQIARLNGRGYTVIGVMPPSFDFPRGIGLWVNMPPVRQRWMTWLQAVVRLKPGVSQTRLQLAAERTLQLQLADYPKEYSKTQHAVVTAIADSLTGTSKPQLLLAFGASALLLLSACVSAGNLFLSRALGRRQEIATRAALGASRRQLIAQFAVEAMVAAAIAAVTGAALAAALIRLLVRWAPAGIPRIEQAGLHLPALAFAVLMTLAAAGACTLGPILLLRGKNLDGLLRLSGARTAGSQSGARLQRLFVLLQTACTVVILLACAMVFFSYRALLGTDTGLGNRDALTINLGLRGPQMSPDRQRQIYLELIERLRASAGIRQAAGVLLRPLEGSIGWDTKYTYEFENGKADPLHSPKANFEVVTPGYFEAIGTPLLRGRDFNDRDSKDSGLVVIISESVAKRFRDAGLDPIGQRMHVFGEVRTVVGLAVDARYRSIRQPGHDVYVPNRQVDTPTKYLIVRGDAPTKEILATVRRIVKELDPGQAIAGEATLGQLIDRNTAGDRFNVALLLMFAVGAIVLTAAGIHSVGRESVTVRAKEIAVRIALGAERGLLAVRTAASLLPAVGAGILLGGSAAVALASAAQNVLYSVSAREPAILFSVAVFVLAVAAISSLLPAWHAAGKDPRGPLLSD